MGSQTVLVVEDEESFVEALLIGLKREGFRVEVARDGAQALDVFDVVRPDLVLLDVMLPRLSGIDVCRQLRKKSRVPIIMVTAKGAEIDTVVGLEVGADRHRPGGGRQAQRERRTLARPRVHLHRTVVVLQDVAHDGEAEPGATGLAAARLVDAVEALEHALEVACRDADAAVAHRDADLRAVGGCEDVDARAGIGVLHRVVEQDEDGRHELPPVAEDRQPVVGLAHGDLDAGVLGGGADPLHRLGDDQVHGHRLAVRRLTALDPAQLQQVLDGPTDPRRLGDDALGETAGDLRVVLVQQRLGEQ